MKLWRLMLSLSAMVGMALAAGGCRGLPNGTLSSLAVGVTQLQASGAGLIKADAQQTTFKIKCAICGYVSEDIAIATPVAGQPYQLDWVCPKCGHKQKIVIRVVSP